MDFFNDLQERCRVREETNAYEQREDMATDYAEYYTLDDANQDVENGCKWDAGTVENDQYWAGAEACADGLDAEGLNVFYLTGFLNMNKALCKAADLSEVAA